MKQVRKCKFWGNDYTEEGYCDNDIRRSIGIK